MDTPVEGAGIATATSGNITRMEAKSAEKVVVNRMIICEIQKSGGVCRERVVSRWWD